MDSNCDSLRNFLERIKNIGFWSRLFGWREIQNLLVDAFGDFQKLLMKAETLSETHSDLTIHYRELQKDFNAARSTLTRYELEIENFRISEQAAAIIVSGLKSDIAGAESTVEAQRDQIVGLEAERRLSEQKAELQSNEITKLAESLATITESRDRIDERKNDLELEIFARTAEVASLRQRNNELENENTVLKTEEESRRQRHDEKTATLVSIAERVTLEREAEKEKAFNDELERHKNRKAVWLSHEENVKAQIKGICAKHAIEYVEKVPFKGSPDNTIKICDEFIVFDAKSPMSDDLRNFPIYLKEQAEKAKKYAKEENVKLEIFLVVPTNTLECISTFVHKMSDYDVYILSLDSLEATMLSLKKIELYEFAQSLSPDDRDNICRILGKFMHLNKRRVQIDAYFIGQAMELAFRTESELPSDVFDKALEFERSDRLNPPSERRDKSLNTVELGKLSTRLIGEASARGMALDCEEPSNGSDDLRLYPISEDDAL